MTHPVMTAAVIGSVTVLRVRVVRQVREAMMSEHVIDICLWYVISTWCVVV